ncbi:SDR family oxidoreductase [bacterium]|nr:SDR family oxidoreductase [bacterium]
MDLGIRNKVAVVIAASRGIGKATALGLAREGCNIAICARGAENLALAHKEAESLGVRVFSERCDVADLDALRGFLDRTKKNLGAVDILINNASAFAFGGGADDWKKSFAIDLMAAVHATEHVLPWMEQSGGGAIVHVSSTAALEAPGPPAYSALKAALLSHAKNISVAHAAHKIRVNCVTPGAVEFPGGIWDDARKNNPEFYQSMLSTIPAGRMVTDEEVADAIIFASSARASGMTGAVLSIDLAQHKGNL